MTSYNSDYLQALWHIAEVEKQQEKWYNAGCSDALQSKGTKNAEGEL